jgi:putative spermidine/putrescine transport system permease protein
MGQRNVADSDVDAAGRNLDMRAVSGLVLLPAVAVLLGFFVLPMMFVAAASVQGGAGGAAGFHRYALFFSTPFQQEILLRTLGISLAVVIATLLLGYPVAYWLVRTKSRFRMLFRAFVFFPLITSSIVRTFGWIILLSNNGFINNVLGKLGFEETQFLYRSHGIIIGLTHVLLPFMILTLMSALANINPALEEASRSLGASPWRSFRRVVLPMSFPGVIAGSLLVFALSTSAFVTPALLGGVQTPVMATLIYRQAVITYDMPSAATTSMLLLAITVVLVTLYYRVARPLPSGRNS